MGELDRLGPRLREARRAREWTLDDLSRAAGISPSTLSRLESGKRQASLELLLPVTRALGIRIDDLLVEPARDPRVRRPARRAEGMIIAPLTVEQSPVQAFKIVYEPRSEAPEPRVHDGWEWLYVLSGRLRLRLGDEALDLGRGEAAQFDTREPHAMWAPGPRRAEVLSIFNAEGERLHTRTSDG
ncbi:helix-turn-helix domain-containing protein [Microbacterium aurantiacum]|uniref:XRE family transcriptional regulator n=1 Tax=Microbacterium aurantiacum TaxID=162393 RepID=A0A0M9VL90_9MICO|nr:XRE family transcriptional regulator [Microbacterium chocolatum]ANG86845.1 XRE family transcriptional regulator [Microbacterium chocolatum]KOS10893.1 XRE family transcriptional regulator [Microbacterium chocolatum]